MNTLSARILEISFRCWMLIRFFSQLTTVIFLLRTRNLWIRSALQFLRKFLSRQSLQRQQLLLIPSEREEKVESTMLQERRYTVLRHSLFLKTEPRARREQSSRMFSERFRVRRELLRQSPSKKSSMSRDQMLQFLRLRKLMEMFWWMKALKVWKAWPLFDILLLSRVRDSSVELTFIDLLNYSTPVTVIPFQAIFRDFNRTESVLYAYCDPSKSPNKAIPLSLIPFPVKSNTTRLQLESLSPHRLNKLQLMRFRATWSPQREVLFSNPSQILLNPSSEILDPSRLMEWMVGTWLNRVLKGFSPSAPSLFLQSPSLEDKFRLHR